MKGCFPFGFDKDKGRAQVSDVCEIINGRAAGIEANPIFVDRFEFVFLAGERVIEFEHE